MSEFEILFAKSKGKNMCQVCKKKLAKYRFGIEGNYTTNYFCSKTCIANRFIEVHRVVKI